MRYIHKDAVVSPEVKIIGDGNLFIDAYAVIEPNVLIDLGANGSIRIGYRSKLKYGSVVRNYDGKITIGSKTSVGEYSILSGQGGLTIGSAVIIAGHCYLSAADHIFTGSDHIRFQGEVATGIYINDGAWIGARSVVLDGVCIDVGCIIGAGSVVLKNMGKDMVCFGNPCREVYKRDQLHEEVE
jgi:acetyltransferase-like isoleucine patch superfamily enzyme